MKKIIWMYWENALGSHRPPYLDLCMQTIEKNRGSYELVVLDEKSVEKYIEVPKKIKMLERIAHRADYIRFHLLYKYGGVWLDSDVVMLRPIDEALEPFKDGYDYIGSGARKGRPSIWFMAAKPGCKLLKLHIDAMDRFFAKKWILFRKKIRIHWAQIGAKLLWKFSEDYEYFHQPKKMFAPLSWQEWEKFLEPPKDLNEILSENPFAVMLYNKMMGPALSETSCEELLSSDTLLATLLKHALLEKG